jgi:RNA polymerase-binding transcription factor DksA
MNIDHKNEFRQKLVQLLDRVRPDVQALTDQACSPASGQGATELSNVPMHLGDAGTDEYLHELNATLLENEGFVLAETRAALDRIDDGSYGNCGRCGQDIALERLRAVPYARYCIRCAAAADQPQVNLNVGRPRSPADTLADEEEMEIKRRGEQASYADMISERTAGDSRSRRCTPQTVDNHAAGTPGGGGAAGGIAGTNQGDGAPDIHELHQTMGSDHFESAEGHDESCLTPVANRNGGAVSGTPATHR